MFARTNIQSSHGELKQQLGWWGKQFLSVYCHHIRQETTFLPLMMLATSLEVSLGLAM